MKKLIIYLFEGLGDILICSYAAGPNLYPKLRSVKLTLWIIRCQFRKVRLVINKKTYFPNFRT